MADAVAAEKRAQDIVDKYRKRMDDWSKLTTSDSVDEHNAIISELKADIANAINAVTAEYDARIVAAEKAAKAAKAPGVPADEPRARPATTHMPATGHDKPAAAASARK